MRELLQEVLDFLVENELDGDSLCMGCGHVYGGHHEDCRWVELTKKLKDALITCQTDQH